MDDQKKRLLIIVLFGLAAIGAVFLFTQPPVPPAVVLPTVAPPVPQPASPATSDANKPILPKGASVAGQVVRDIFSPPAEYARLLPQEPRPGSPGGGPAISAGPTPVLTGILSGDGTRVAILRQGAVSRSYRVGESAGAYRIASIGADVVTLAGPSGTVVLMMGQ